MRVSEIVAAPFMEMFCRKKKAEAIISGLEKTDQ